MKLVKIDSSSIQIRTDLEAFRNIKINDLLLVSDSSISLVTIVTSLMDSDAEERIGDEDFLGEITGIKTITCSIMGSLKDGKFVKAIDQYPTTSVSISRIRNQEFSQMIAPDGERKSYFHIGKYAAYDCPAYVDGNKFFQRHACIVGNTGSGKSETVAKIMQEAAKLPAANLVVFDIHGEYSNLSYASTIKIGEDFDFPIWMFGFYDIATNILRIKEETATSIMAGLRKAYYRVCPNGKENKPVFFSYFDLIKEVKAMNEQTIGTGEYYKSGEKAGMEKRSKGEYNGKLHGVINLLEDRMRDSRYAFLFKDNPPEYLYKIMGTVLGNQKPVKVIDLSAIPHDVVIPIIGVITRIIFDLQRQQNADRIRPVTIICDEAHVYIPNNFDLSSSQRRMVEVFEDIAKEGRKFGITLFTATQRPSELNRTIVAQCANLIVGKLNNDNDKQLIKGMLPDGDSTVIDSVSMFNPGDVLIIGDAVPVPLKIKAQLAKERPVSRTIDFWSIWSNAQEYDLEEMIDSYMRR